ncbi:MAG TPA: hypothetical protein VE990_20245 [Acidimicrobiales bacterium]|nr:hypothetical protein [Acidimicrobiales bacterium]
MTHPSAGEIRRLADDPWAVRESTRLHVRACDHCARRQRKAEADAGVVQRALRDLPEVDPGVELAWARLRRRLESGEAAPAGAVPPRLNRRLRRRTVALGLGGVVVLGATSAAAAGVVSVLSPSKVAPVQLNDGDVSSLLHALPAATLTQSDAGQAYPVGSVAEAEADTGLSFRLPPHLPSGVAASPRISVQPRVSLTLSFGQSSGRRVGRGAAPAWLEGTTLHIEAGPAVLVNYPGGSTPAGLPGLVVGYSAAPVVTATGASPQSIEDYVLSQPGVSPALAAEIRVLGAPGAVLPLPIPSGASVRNTTVAGSPAVVLTDPSGIASGVIWEEGKTVRVVGGLVSADEAVAVADELG